MKRPKETEMRRIFSKQHKDGSPLRAMSKVGATLVAGLLMLVIALPAGATAHSHHATHHHAKHYVHHALRHHRAHKADDVEVDFILEGPTPFTPEDEAEALALLAEAEAEEGPDPAVTQCVVMED